MNNWSQIKRTAIVEADDFQDRYDRNGLNFLFYWKTKYPKFKITLFTIPDRTSPQLLELMFKHKDWIELAVHGFNHESNYECYGWSYDKTKALMERVRKNKVNEPGKLDYSFHYQPIFKAPGWTITHSYNGYPVTKDNVNETNRPIFEDPTGVYRALIDMDFIIFDRHYNAPIRPQLIKEKIICVDCQPDLVHMHTWDMPTGNKNEQNGFRQVEEEHGVPWNQETEFLFVSEAFKEGRFTPCKK